MLTILLFFAFFTLFGEKNKIFSKKNGFFTEKGAFLPGEVLKYKISYGRQGKKRGSLFAANATLSIEESMLNDSTSIYLLKASGKTRRLFNLIMNVEHSYYSSIERKSLNTIKSDMKIREGKYKLEHNAEFHINDSINDILSVLYKLRSIPNTNIEKLDTLFFSYYYSGKIYKSHAIKNGTEELTTKLGKIQTVQWSPLLEKGRVFKQEWGAKIWVTNDQMHVPIKLEIPILVGSIYVNLVSCENTIFELKK